ncbi:MAG: 30S ribosomal protein S17 [Patescibacteria group bacterium]
MDSKKIKTLVGIVTSTKMKDTVTVRVNRFVKMPKYKKYVLRSKKYLAHAPGNTLTEGDRVTIRSTRPISKRKHFEVVN